MNWKAPLFSAGLVFCLTAGGVASQGTEVPFSGLQHDASTPVEITADRLQLDQAEGTAVFEGTVVVGQGTLRMAADQLDVFYDGGQEDATGTVRRMIASGNVTLFNGAESAESDQAIYDVASSVIEMEGNVLLTQGENALAGEQLRIDLNLGTAVLEGRVKTIFVPDSASQ